MKCPICDDHKNIEINMHSEGYASNLFECGTCETVWSERLAESDKFEIVILTSF